MIPHFDVPRLTKSLNDLALIKQKQRARSRALDLVFSNTEKETEVFEYNVYLYIDDVSDEPIEVFELNDNLTFGKKTKYDINEVWSLLVDQLQSNLPRGEWLKLENHLYRLTPGYDRSRGRDFEPILGAEIKSSVDFWEYLADNLAETKDLYGSFYEYEIRYNNEAEYLKKELPSDKLMPLYFEFTKNLPVNRTEFSVGAIEFSFKIWIMDKKWELEE